MIVVLKHFVAALVERPLKSAIGALLCFAFGVFVAGPLGAWLASGPSVVVNPGTHMVGVAQGGGGVLALEIDQTRTRVCNATITRVLWRWKPSSRPPMREILPFDFDGVADPFPGENHFQLDLPILPHLAPGIWHYTGFYHEHCPVFGWIWPDKVRQTQDTLVSVSSSLPSLPAVP